MIRLARTVRFNINPGQADIDFTAGDNGYAGKPVMRGLGRYYELTVRCVGEANPTTGYLINIKDIDQAVRARALPIIARACADHPETEPATLLPELFGTIDHAIAPTVCALTWTLSPYHRVEMIRDQTTNHVPAASTQGNAPAASRALIRLRFDFAAAHRLHAPALSDEENRNTFGRCNNPSGHGHNYQVEPAVEVDLDADAPFTAADIERLTHETVIDPFDHTHLDRDRPEFAPANGRTSSVENIARVMYDRLAPVIERESQGSASLRALTVWETDRTSCTYPAIFDHAPE